MSNEKRKVEVILRDPGMSWHEQMEKEDQDLIESDAETVNSPYSDEYLDPDVEAELLRQPVGENSGNSSPPLRMKSPREELTDSLANTSISENSKEEGTHGQATSAQIGIPVNQNIIAKSNFTTTHGILPEGDAVSGRKKRNRKRKPKGATDSTLMPPPSFPVSKDNRKRQSSTSPQGKPTKRNWQVEGVKVFVTYSHDTMLSISNDIYVQFKEFIDLQIVDTVETGFLIQIESRALSLGHIVYTWANQETAKWLIKSADEFRQQGSSTESQDLRLKGWLSVDFSRTVFTVMTRGVVKPNFAEIFRLLAKQNENFSDKFRYMVARIVTCDGFFVTYLIVDEELKLYLRARDGILYYLSSKIEFRE